LYARPFTAFQTPIEFGINVPYEDYRFLRAYEAHNFYENQDQDISTITTASNMGNRVTEIAINDFDGNRIRNTVNIFILTNKCFIHN
jgi:hypothetical protein